MLLLTVTGYGLLITLIWWPIDFLIIVFGEFHDGHDARLAW